MNYPSNPEGPNWGLQTLRVLAALLVVAVIVFGIALEISVQ